VGRGLGWERFGGLGVIVILVLTFLLLEGEDLSESKCSVRKLISIERSGLVLERSIKGIESG